MAVVTSTDQVVITSYDTLTNIFPSEGITSPSNDTSINIEGTASVRARVFKTGLGGIVFDFGVGLQDLSSTLIFVWVRTLDAVDSKVNGGWRIRVSSDTEPSENNFGEWFVDGFDTYRAIVEGYGLLVVDTILAFDATLGTPPALTSVRTFTALGDHLSASTRDTFFIDKSSFGTGITIKGGLTTDAGISSEVATSDESNLNARGVFKNIAGAMYITGRLTFGDTGAVDSFFRDTNQFWLFENKKVGITRHQIVGVGNGGQNTEFSMGTKVGTGVTASGISGNTIKADGPPYRVIFTDANIDVNLFGCSFINSPTAGGTIQLEQVNVDCISCLFASCGVITVRNNSVLKKATITGSTSLIGSAALDFGGVNPNATANSVRDISIIGGVNGINLVGTGNISYDFVNITFSGQTGKKVRVDFGATDTVTINVSEGGTSLIVGDLDIVTVGTTVVINNATVDTLITVLDGRTSPPPVLQNARVLVEARDGTGDLPFQDSVTITRSGSIASVIHTAHGLLNGDKIIIEGANQSEYNGVKLVSNITTNGYDFTVSGTPTTPATGTITATGVVLEGLTDVNGEIKDTRSWTLAQPIIGTARLHTVTPFFKNGSIFGTVSVTSGFSSILQLTIDE